jgi:phosphoglycolate phosphatase-like HAD superfamily hydrolase
MDNIKILVFDFDGTLADSNAVKRNAWRKVFDDRPKEQDLELQKNVDAEIGDRYKILSATFSAVGETSENISGLVKKYADKFNSLVQTGIAGAGLFPGVLEMLADLKKTHKLYLNSATPIVALKTAAQNLKINNYFEGLFGSEFSKVENLRQIADLEKCEPWQMIMIGDGRDDLAGAREFGCDFIGIANESNNWDKEDIGYPVVKNINVIARSLQ